MEKITLLKAIVGSQAYGTNTPESDIDYKEIYIQNPIDILSMGFKQQIEVNKDHVCYEVQRFIELLMSSNPTMLELLFVPEDCIVEKHPLFDIILEHKQSFITKECANSFAGYARQQIHKARGLDKKINWEANRVERKRPIDFMKVIDKEKSYQLTKYLKTHNLKEEFCGLVKVNDTEGLYCLYYDDLQHMMSEVDINNPRYRDWKPHGYKGVCNDDMIFLSEVPEWQIANGKVNIQYNEKGFTEHCKDYNSYQTWLKERNTQRYVDVKNHGQKIDGKNMLHCMRLIQMAHEIAKDGELNIRRPNAKDLIKIRKGEVCLEEILTESEKLVSEMDQLFKNSNIPDKIDREFAKQLLREIRIGSFDNRFNWTIYKDFKDE